MYDKVVQVLNLFFRPSQSLNMIPSMKILLHLLVLVEQNHRDGDHTPRTAQGDSAHQGVTQNKLGRKNMTVGISKEGGIEAVLSMERKPINGGEYQATSNNPLYEDPP